MATKEKTCKNISVSADQASKDGVLQFRTRTYEKLIEAGVNITETRKVIFGIKKYPFKNGGGHRAVILKLPEQENTAFILELEIDLPKDEKTYIKGLFSCPDHTCNFNNKTYQEITEHHLTTHRKLTGDNVEHRCCRESFKVYEQFCAHQFEKHRSFRSVIPNFEQVIKEKYDKFLAPDKVTFYEQFEKSGTMEQMIEAACEIILSFGRYWIFMWNCQDFAAWFLYSMGIPLQELEPTLPDKLTGTGTSGGKVQSYKGWAWYKISPQLQEFGLDYLGGVAVCVHCEFLPPLSFKALESHILFAHPKQN